MIAVGYNAPGDEERARKIVEQHLAWFSLTHGTRCTADLNQSWETKPGEPPALGISVADTAKVTDDIRVTRLSMQTSAFIVSATFDSAKLASYSNMVRKSQQDPALAKALEYFSQEVIDDDRPLYGIYKAIEALTEVLPGGRGELGMLAGCPNKKAGKRYVDDIMETAGLTRHHNDPNAHPVLSDAECRERARTLIEAYAKSIP